MPHPGAARSCARAKPTARVPSWILMSPWAVRPAQHAVLPLSLALRHERPALEHERAIILVPTRGNCRQLRQVALLGPWSWRSVDLAHQTILPCHRQDRALTASTGTGLPVPILIVRCRARRGIGRPTPARWVTHRTRARKEQVDARMRRAQATGPSSHTPCRGTSHTSQDTLWT